MSALLFAPGVVLAQKYRLERLLGQGGMGSVWLAENEDIGRTVAIKFLLPMFATDAEMMKRFRLEARAAAAIGHPGIVDVLDMGQLPDGSAFIVMEQLRGETLGHRLERLGPLDVPGALWVIDRAADAVGAAHAAGVVHRDLKPDNLFVVQRPVPALKVLDFGISKFKAGGAEDLSLTRTGITMGTPLYMSPEQARGAKTVGPSADLYSLGGIFYHLLAGIPPFEGSSYNELLARVLTESHRPIRDVRPDTPEPLARLVDALLGKQGEQRPDTARIRAVVAECYALLGLSRETPPSIAQPPGLDDPPPAEPSLLQGTGPLDGTARRGVPLDDGDTLSPWERAGVRARSEASLEHTSPSQRRPSVETPLPSVAAQIPLERTSPSQRGPSVVTSPVQASASAVATADAPSVASSPQPARKRSPITVISIVAGSLIAAAAVVAKLRTDESPEKPVAPEVAEPAGLRQSPVTAPGTAAVEQGATSHGATPPGPGAPPPTLTAPGTAAAPEVAAEQGATQQGTTPPGPGAPPPAVTEQQPPADPRTFAAPSTERAPPVPAAARPKDRGRTASKPPTSTPAEQPPPNSTPSTPPASPAGTDDIDRTSPFGSRSP